MARQTLKITREESDIYQKWTERNGAREAGKFADQYQREDQRVHVKGGIDLQTPTQPKRPEMNVSESFVFLKEKARDQKAADHKEQIDPTPSNSSPDF